MTQTQKYNLTQYLKILSIVGATITFGIQTGTLIKKGTEWYAGIIVVMGKQKNIDEAQTDWLIRNSKAISNDDSILSDHERRLSRTEIDVELMKLKRR
jgi:hypothetical protein